VWRDLQHPDDLTMMVEWLTTPALADTLAHSQHQVPGSSIGVTSAVQVDVDSLLTSGTIERGPSVVFAHVFTVPKSDGASSRFIWGGRTFDKILRKVFPRPPDVLLPHSPEVVDELLRGWRVISTNDAKSMFFQFGLHQSLRKFFGFRISSGGRGVEAECFRMCALPMGVCIAPTFAPNVSKYICAVVRHRLLRHVRFCPLPRSTTSSCVRCRPLTFAWSARPSMRSLAR
jgi:hypothetical protein